MWRIRALWVPCLVFAGCFDDPAPSSTDGTSVGSGNGDGGSTSPATDSGVADSTSTGSATTDTADSSGDANTTGQPAGLLFDFYTEACGDAVIRGGEGMMGRLVPLDCARMDPAGTVLTFETFDTINGMATEVVAFGFPPVQGAAVGLETVDAVSLSTAVAPRLLAQLDCPPLTTGAFDWLVLLTPNGVDYAPVGGGTHTCGDPRTVLDLPLENDTDSRMSIAVINGDASMRQALLIGPVVIDE